MGLGLGLGLGFRLIQSLEATSGEMELCRIGRRPIKYDVRLVHELSAACVLNRRFVNHMSGTPHDARRNGSALRDSLVHGAL